MRKIREGSKNMRNMSHRSEIPLFEAKIHPKSFYCMKSMIHQRKSKICSQNIKMLSLKPRIRLVASMQKFVWGQNSSEDFLGCEKTSPPITVLNLFVSHSRGGRKGGWNKIVHILLSPEFKQCAQNCSLVLPNSGNFPETLTNKTKSRSLHNCPRLVIVGQVKVDLSSFCLLKHLTVSGCGFVFLLLLTKPLLFWWTQPCTGVITRTFCRKVFSERKEISHANLISVNHVTYSWFDPFSSLFIVCNQRQRRVYNLWLCSIIIISDIE